MTTESVVAHKIRWFVWAWDHAGNKERMPRTSRMRGLWGYDVECSCGWVTRTGGATRRSVEQDVESHKFEHGLTRWQQESGANHSS